MAARAVFGSTFSLRPQIKSFQLCRLPFFRLTSSFVGKPAKPITAALMRDYQESTRTFKTLPPSEWTHHFLSVPLDVLEMDALKREVDGLKPKVKNKLMSIQGIDLMKKRILMIYTLVSLGLGYHFEDEIEESLRLSFEKIDDVVTGDDDLYTVSIIFWVFRTYGHNISSDVFKKFMGNNAKFKECLIEDAKGLLSLYEAAHLRTTTDYIMEEALSFTTSNLESLASCGTCPSHLSMRIRNALGLPQHWNMGILFAVEYILFYEQEEDHDQLLLKFSKTNFNLLQLHYIQELKMVTRWYKELDFASKLPPYFRDRIVENHFLFVGMFVEPQFSRERIMLTKFLTASVLLDDTCDRYASLSEAESLTASLERWAPNDAIEKQPDYLKFVFEFIVNVFDEFEREMGSEGRSYSVKATIEEFKIYARANLELVKWEREGRIPGFKEYMDVSEVDIAVYSTTACLLMAMGSFANEEAYEWLRSRPRLVHSLSRKARLLNDITGFEDDMSRGCATTAVNCYMKQYGGTTKEVIVKLSKMVADNDYILNEEFLKKTNVPQKVSKIVINFARMMTVIYNEGEGYTHPQGKMYEDVVSLFVNRLSL